MDIDLSGGFARWAQDFDDPSDWCVGFSLDSASTTWVSTVPDDIWPGDIAVEDEDLGEGVDTLVTAVVTHTSTAPTSEIRMVLIDKDGNSAYDDTFSANTGTAQPFCRHPVVEVTYSRGENDTVGVARIHVVWSQFTDGGLQDDHWDLYYRYLKYVVDDEDTEVDWDSPDTDTTVQLPFCTYDDELEPDICVLATVNDLFVTYLLDDGPQGYDYIKGARHQQSYMEYPGTWSTSSTISGSSRYEKFAPRIDGGIFTYRHSAMHAVGGLAAVWNENVSTAGTEWQVFYNDCDPLSGWTGTPVQISPRYDPETPYFNYLPQVDITPQSSGINEAVIAWSSACPTSTVVRDVMITATPYLNEAVQIITGEEIAVYNQCPDVACYQMYDEDEHWFGLSTYGHDTANSAWDYYVYRFSLEVVYGEHGYATFSFEDKVDNPAEGQWNWQNPFTGPTLCLRWPVTPVVQTLFGLGWVDEDYMIQLTEGDIY